MHTRLGLERTGFMTHGQTENNKTTKEADKRQELSSWAPWPWPFSVSAVVFLVFVNLKRKR